MRPARVAKLIELRILREIGKQPGWLLYERKTRKPSDGWVSLLLFPDPPAEPWPRKTVYWIGWSVEEMRLARSSDAGLLHQRHPAIYSWVIDRCLAEFNTHFPYG